MISDQLNLTGANPLAGPPPPDRLGTRFADLTDLYSERLRRAALDADDRRGGGGVRGPARRELRDAGGDPDARPAGCRRGGHVHGAGGHRRPPPRRGGVRGRRWSPTWPPGSSGTLDHLEVLAGRRGRGTPPGEPPPLGAGRRLTPWHRRPRPRELVARAERWRDADPDPATRAEVRAILARGDPDELAARFGGRVDFGTAGLRAARRRRPPADQPARGPPDRRRAVQGPARPGAPRHRGRRGGRPRRPHRLGTLRRGRGRGARGPRDPGVTPSTDPSPTPLAAFAVGHLGAAAAVVVTASHNPPADNGIKVFWSDGAQIAPPLDAEIARAIDERRRRRGGRAADRTAGAGRPSGRRGRGHPPGGRLHLRRPRSWYRARRTGPLPVAVTSLHGVGASLLDRVLTGLGHGPVHHVAVPARARRRASPPWSSPTPRSPARWTQLLALARSTRRRRGAWPTTPTPTGWPWPRRGRAAGWHPLTGDQTGALLARRRLQLTEGTPDRLLVTTVVSSRLLGRDGRGRRRPLRGDPHRVQVAVAARRWSTPGGTR